MGGVPPAWAPTLCPSLPTGVFAPTLFSKVYGKLVCGECHNVTQNPLGHYLCHNCHFDLVRGGQGPPPAEVWGRGCSEPTWLLLLAVAAGLSLVPCIPFDRLSLHRWRTTAPSTIVTSSECLLGWGQGCPHSGVAPPRLGCGPTSLPGPLFATLKGSDPAPPSLPSPDGAREPCQGMVTLNMSPMSHRPLVYTVSLLLPAAYLIGLFFTLKTHSHIYDIHISDCHSECPQTAGCPGCRAGSSHCPGVSHRLSALPPVPGHHHSAVVHWSRWRALVILLLSTLCMSACADLATEHISPILTNSTISQVSVGMAVSLLGVALGTKMCPPGMRTCPGCGVEPQKLGDKVLRCSMHRGAWLSTAWMWSGSGHTHMLMSPLPCSTSLVSLCWRWCLSCRRSLTASSSPCRTT